MKLNKFEVGEQVFFRTEPTKYTIISWPDDWTGDGHGYYKVEDEDGKYATFLCHCALHYVYPDPFERWVRRIRSKHE